jgi:hypothetical protein
MPDKNPVDRHAELLEVQLLDVLATVESVLRHGREVQHEALRACGVPSPVTSAQKRTSATAIRERVNEMKSDCTALCRVVEDLHVCAVEFEQLMET